MESDKIISPSIPAAEGEGWLRSRKIEVPDLLLKQWNERARNLHDEVAIIEIVEDTSLAIDGLTRQLAHRRSAGLLNMLLRSPDGITPTQLERLWIRSDTRKRFQPRVLTRAIKSLREMEDKSGRSILLRATPQMPVLRLRSDTLWFDKRPEENNEDDQAETFAGLPAEEELKKWNEKVKKRFGKKAVITEVFLESRKILIKGHLYPLKFKSTMAFFNVLAAYRHRTLHIKEFKKIAGGLFTDSAGRLSGRNLELSISELSEIKVDDEPLVIRDHDDKGEATVQLNPRLVLFNRQETEASLRAVPKASKKRSSKSEPMPSIPPQEFFEMTPTYQVDMDNPRYEFTIASSDLLEYEQQLKDFFLGRSKMPILVMTVLDLNTLRPRLRSAVSEALSYVFDDNTDEDEVLSEEISLTVVDSDDLSARISYYNQYYMMIKQSRERHNAS